MWQTTETQPMTKFLFLSWLQVLPRESSQDSVAPVTSLSSAQLEGMSAAVLRDLISQLQEDLIAAAQHNSMLQQQLEGRNQSQAAGSGEGSSRQTEGGAACSVSELQTQVSSGDVWGGGRGEGVPLHAAAAA